LAFNFVVALFSMKRRGKFRSSLLKIYYFFVSMTLFCPHRLLYFTVGETPHPRKSDLDQVQ